MTEGHAVEPEQGGAGKTLKRRGILAVAAVVAGIVTKQASQPVQASGGFTQIKFTATGDPLTSDVGFDASASLFFTGVSGKGRDYGVIGVIGYSTGSAGVIGYSIENTGTGVQGGGGGTSPATPPASRSGCAAASPTPATASTARRATAAASTAPPRAAPG